MAYECLPTHCIGVMLNSAPGLPGVWTAPAITAAVASTGNAAIEPGNALRSLKATAATTMPPRPPHAMAARIDDGIRITEVPSTARPAPTSSSHTRFHG